jgi:hypothetical protein
MKKLREQWVSNRCINSEMIPLKKTNHLNVKKDIGKADQNSLTERRHYLFQIDSIINKAKGAINKGYNLPKTLQKFMIYELYNYKEGEDAYWPLDELRKDIMAQKALIEAPNDRNWSKFSDMADISDIYDGFVDAREEKAINKNLKIDVDSYLKKKRYRPGRIYGYTLGYKKKRLYNVDFEKYFQSGVMDPKTVSNNLKSMGLWDLVLSQVEASKKLS